MASGVKSYRVRRERDRGDFCPVRCHNSVSKRLLLELKAILIEQCANGVKTMRLLSLCLLILLAVAGVGPAAAAAPPLAQEKLVAEIKAWVGNQLATTPDLIEVPPLDSRLNIPKCQGQSSLGFPFSTKDVVRARCSNPEWQTNIRVAVHTPRKGVFASRALPGGKILTDADLAVGLVAVAAADIFEDRHLLIGKSLKRSLQAGEAILAQNVEDLREVLRVTQNINSGDLLTASNYRVETIARNLSPKGAVAGESHLSGARANHDLQAGQILLAEDIAQLRRIIVVKRDVEIGQSADSTLFETVERNPREPADSLLSDTSNLASVEFSRNIKAGEAVRRTDLKPALLIRRGQAVVVTLATSNGLELTFHAEALHDARMGESVTLKNIESGKNMQGIVTGRGSARPL